MQVIHRQLDPACTHWHTGGAYGAARWPAGGPLGAAAGVCVVPGKPDLPAGLWGTTPLRVMFAFAPNR